MLHLLAEHITYVILLPRLTTTSDSVVSNFSKFHKGKQEASKLIFYYLLKDALPHLDIARCIDLKYNKRRREFEQLCAPIIKSRNSYAYF